MKRTQKILVVDDHPTNVQILEEILEDDYELSVAMSGEECLEIAPGFTPDLILLDIMMPGMDGYEACRQLRANPALRSTKIIMVSAKAMISERLRGYEVGANDYITKPFEEEELRAKVRVFLELKSAEEVNSARQAGMAEVATGILHNVGNVLNSVNISVSSVGTLMHDSRVEDLVAISRVLDEQEDLGEFVTQDQRGKLLRPYLKKMGQHLQSTNERVLEEIELLSKNITHIKQIIRLQQDYAATHATQETVALSETFGDALQLNGGALENNGIRVVRKYADEPVVTTDSHKLLQILTNLIRNAQESLVESGAPDMTIELGLTVEEGERVRMTVTDNGMGVDPDDLDCLFRHGFTTKKEGHGFGLHNSALAAASLGGTLTANSDGCGKGATFTLEIPLRQKEQVAA